jgi:hypothetical protein
MNERIKWAMVLATITVFMTTAAVLPGLVRAGDLEPSAPPGSTMHTLDEIYQKLEQLVPGGLASLAKTGQTTSYAAGDDGDLQKGVDWPDPRFTDHEDGTVTDNLTGLMWTKNASIYERRSWSEAISECASCAEGGYSDWRLPHVRELHSLIDYSQCDSVLPLGHPFSNVQLSYYWSSTTYANFTSHAWYVHVSYGHVSNDGKIHDHYVWCVRGGQ